MWDLYKHSVESILAMQQMFLLILQLLVSEGGLDCMDHSLAAPLHPNTKLDRTKVDGSLVLNCVCDTLGDLGGQSSEDLAYCYRPVDPIFLDASKEIVTTEEWENLHGDVASGQYVDNVCQGPFHSRGLCSLLEMLGPQPRWTRSSAWFEGQDSLPDLQPGHLDEGFGVLLLWNSGGVRLGMLATWPASRSRPEQTLGQYPWRWEPELRSHTGPPGWAKRSVWYYAYPRCLLHLHWAWLCCDSLLSCDLLRSGVTDWQPPTYQEYHLPHYSSTACNAPWWPEHVSGCSNQDPSAWEAVQP